MKTQKIKKCMSLFLAALMCVTTLFGVGTTAYAAEETDEVCLVSFPRDGHANYGGEWGPAVTPMQTVGAWQAPAIPPSAQWVRMPAISVTALTPAFRRNRAAASPKRAKTFGTIPPRPTTALFRPTI